MVKKAVLKGSIFLIILTIISFMLGSAFTLKAGHSHYSKLKQGLYTDFGDTYDVVMIGSSHMNGGINPNILWNEYGITSFNYATAGQPIDVSYYLLKEVLKKNKNPIVVVDLYYLGLINKFGEEGYIRYVLDSLELSPNKIDAIMNCTPKREWPDYLFPILKYHSRWKDLKEEDFKFDISSTYYSKGFDAGHNSYGKDRELDGLAKGMADLPPKSEEYLYKIIELSKKEGFKLICTNMPYDYASTVGRKNWHQDTQRMFNKVENILQENNIPFINYCNMFDELGFDFKTDMFNVGHLNVDGAEKITKYLGTMLEKTYNIKDHRGDKSYKQWDDYYKIYLKKYEQAALAEKKSH